MKRVLSFLLFLGLLNSSGAIETKTVVFVDRFTPNDGCSIPPGQLQVLHDRIIGNVTSSQKYRVVDRENLDRVQKELEVVAAGLTEGKAPEEGRLTVAGYCVYGKVLQYRSYGRDLDVVRRVYGIVEVQLRIEDIQSGQILASPTVKMEESRKQLAEVPMSQNLAVDALALALDKCAKEVVFRLNEIAFPVYVDDADGKYVTGNVAAEQVSIGDLWDVWKRGNKINDRETGKWTGRYREKLICKVKVALPGAHSTKFECMTEKDGKALEDLLNQDVVMILRRAPKAEGTAAPVRRLRLDNIR